MTPRNDGVVTRILGPLSTLPVYAGLASATGTASWNRKGDHVPLRWVLVKDAGSHRARQAFFSIDPDRAPETIVAYVVRRWRVEVTFAETCAHLGAEIQRPGRDLAILRTTPALLGLGSLVCLRLDDLIAKAAGPRGVIGTPRPSSPSPTRDRARALPALARQT